ncbi:MAG: hypothetical protein CO013_12370 [Syntrophobacterales bacterium CG_4_8_14_3_um_filter_58_8]|nr:MAG: hypothetical protein COS57_13085 [Syntrophobacterales bacterium CG03_land_8_20_14_0_80_58_14]PJC71875.1 MAG: hypothetical protein CO013_12370 [Syntrophobacterales bacterium CG_4_8_14_3_um_filter_58_8]
MARKLSRRGMIGADGPGGRLWPGAFILLLLFLPPAVLATSPAWGAELRIPDLKGRSGQEVRVPLVIDQTANLAGVKLILHYDKELLTFKEGNKSPATQSLMHIINDKTPGKLIIVMAGARGIQGKEMTILTLTFAIKKGLTGNYTTAIEAPEVQLMGDDLKEIECKVKPGMLVILP